MVGTKRFVALSVVGILVAAVGIGYWQRGTALAWYYARQLSVAEPEHCEDLATKLESLGQPGVRAIVELLTANQDAACRNASIALGALLHRWGATDPRANSTLQYAISHAAGFSPTGQRECLGLLHQLISETSEANAELCGLAARLLGHLGSQPEARRSALQLAAELLRRETGATEALVTRARAWVVAGLQDPDAAVRAAAVRVAVVPELHTLELLPGMVTGSRMDSSPEVRQLIILALGNVETLMSTESLCRFLNDEAIGVRQAAEQALRVRGLSAQQVELARLVQHPSAASRAQLPALVMEVSEVDALTWLERLSRDQAPAVRAATARAIGQQADPRFDSVIRHLAESDPDETVQSIARYFLLDQKRQ